MKDANTTQPAPFPLGFCLASIACTSLGLIVAAAGVQWGAARSNADALRGAWVYVSIALALMWCVVWPALPRGASGSLRWRLAAAGIGALPALIVAGVVTGAGAGAVGKMLLLHGALGVFATGIVAASDRAKWLAVLLPALALAGPVVAFIASDLLPWAWSGWNHAVPTIVAARVAGAGAPSTTEVVLASFVYGAAGVLLLLLVPRTHPE